MKIGRHVKLPQRVFFLYITTSTSFILLIDRSLVAHGTVGHRSVRRFRGLQSTVYCNLQKLNQKPKKKPGVIEDARRLNHTLFFIRFIRIVLIRRCRWGWDRWAWI